MTTFSRLQLGILLIGSLIAAVCCLRPDWARTLGLDPWNVPALEADLEAQQERSNTLDDDCEDVLQRINTKEEIAKAVLGGRMDLLHAAAAFRDVTPPGSKARSYLQMAYSGVSDDERYCRAVIRWVQGLAAAQSHPLAQRQVARLEAELNEHLRRNGRITLPQ
jgi:hypothetical protein